MTDYIPICKKLCNKDMTKREVLTDTKKCNFCDVPYIIIEEEQEEMISNKYRECPYFTIEDIGTTHQPVIRMSCDHSCADENGIRPDDCPLLMTTSESRIYYQISKEREDKE